MSSSFPSSAGQILKMETKTERRVRPASRAFGKLAPVVWKHTCPVPRPRPHPRACDDAVTVSFQAKLVRNEKI